MNGTVEAIGQLDTVLNILPKSQISVHICVGYAEMNHVTSAKVGQVSLSNM